MIEKVKPFIVIELKRVEKGLKLFIKSEEFENYFKSMCTERVTVTDSAPCRDAYQGKEAYKVPADAYRYEFCINKWGHPLTVDYERVNLSFLRTVGLSQGVEFIFEGVYSLGYVQEFAKKVKELITAFYKQYIKPFTFRVEITIKEVM